ncbi:MAG: cobalt ECF transporter T component CbiQ, partial [Chloroflexi bacterium]
SLFLRSYERSERVYAAMLARGFATPVNSPKHSPLPWQDVLLSVIPIAAVVSIQILARMWWGA